MPFLFTIKELEAKGTADAFGGEFTVPSYRGSSFLDPKARPAILGVSLLKDICPMRITGLHKLQCKHLEAALCAYQSS